MSQLPQPDAFDVLDLLSQSEKSPASTVLDTQSPSMLPTLPETLTQLPGVQLPFSFPTGDGESPTFVASPEQPVKRIKLVDVCCETLSFYQIVYLSSSSSQHQELTNRIWRVLFSWRVTCDNMQRVHCLFIEKAPIVKRRRRSNKLCFEHGPNRQTSFSITKYLCTSCKTK